MRRDQWIKGIPIGLFAVLIAGAISLASPASAAVRQYLLDGANSQVGFTTDFGDAQITGKFPVSEATVQLDFRDISKSSFTVKLSVRDAVANFPFAAQAMKGPKVLDARHFPTAIFQSSAIRRSGEGAVVDGVLTVRGVSRAVSLQAVLWRAAGSEPGDLDHLVVRLTGSIRRSAFGATGWPNAVGDEVHLEVLARIARTE